MILRLLSHTYTHSFVFTGMSSNLTTLCSIFMIIDFVYITHSFLCCHRLFNLSWVSALQTLSIRIRKITQSKPPKKTNKGDERLKLRERTNERNTKYDKIDDKNRINVALFYRQGFRCAPTASYTFQCGLFVLSLLVCRFVYKRHFQLSALPLCDF